jgi:hypothetical protein
MNYTLYVMYVCIYVFVYVMYVQMCVFMYVRIQYMCTYVCMYVCVYVCMYYAEATLMCPLRTVVIHTTVRRHRIPDRMWVALVYFRF